MHTCCPYDWSLLNGIAASRDRDPLGYRDHIRFDIEGVGRDGMGGVVANDHGSIYRMDVLKDGKDAKGKQIVPEAKMKNRESVGKGLGFSDRTVRESLAYPAVEGL